uniref:replication helicase subunit n=1 Tax=Lithodesmioides polymorpha TaxID=1003075 RepID=UPI0022377E87|nr:replication helicase subunit [Lithodesmioides polymorpha]UYC30946.1 replication helicase subunit [Lithodesmioides polymorpha]
MQKFNETTGQLTIERYLPHHFLAEKIILSSLLISSEAIDFTLKTVTSETFYFRNHQEIYKAIIIMYKQKLPIDILTLNTFLQDNGLLERIGGINVLIELINQIPNLVYLEEYIRLIQDKFLRRSLIKLGYKTINSGYITNLPLETILREFETEAFNLTNKIKGETLSNSAELFSNVFSELKKNSLNSSLSGLSSGFYHLDSFTQGFQKSDLTILAGRPSMGKTALSLNITLNIIKNYQLPILFFSLEMSKEQLIYRLLSNETNINQMRLRSGKLSKNEWLKLIKKIKELSICPLFLDDTPNLSIQDIRSKIKTIIFEQNKIGLVIIDYLQLMQNSNFYKNNRVQELSYITRSLKSIAREFKVPLIVLSQLSRNVESRINKRPILSDLRESGSIEQDADLVLMLYRDNYYNFNDNENAALNSAELIIAKQRNGPTGTIELCFDATHMKFLNIQQDPKN